jgi:hypothetical protein
MGFFVMNSARVGEVVESRGLMNAPAVEMYVTSCSAGADVASGACLPARGPGDYLNPQLTKVLPWILIGRLYALGCRKGVLLFLQCRTVA